MKRLKIADTSMGLESMELEQATELDRLLRGMGKDKKIASRATKIGKSQKRPSLKEKVT